MSFPRCRNCGRTTGTHCRLHVTPCCPGKCPGPATGKMRRIAPREQADREWGALREVETCARAYAALSHGNLSGNPYRVREEYRDRLLDALSRLDVVRQRAA